MADQQSLQDIGLYIGMSLEVLTENNTLTFWGRISKIEDNSVHIVDAAGDELPPTIFNQVLKLRGFTKNMTAILLRGQICGSSPEVWRVDRLDAIQIEEHRAYFRQRIDGSAMVMRVNRIFTSGEAAAAKRNSGCSGSPCSILDVSAGGLLIRCKEPYQVGDWLYLIDALIVPEVPPFSLTCRIRRVQKNQQGYLYGCEFQELSQKEEDRLLQAIFSAQRKELAIQRTREKNWHM